MSAAPLVATFVRDMIAAWPEEKAKPGDRQKVAKLVTTMTLVEALTKTHDNDAHVVAYTDLNRLSLRLNTAYFDRDARAAAISRRVLREEVRAALLAVDYAVDVIAFIADVDDSVAHEQKIPARDEWRRVEQSKIIALLLEHPGAFLYETKGGFRVVYLIEPFHIASREDAARWSKHYKLLCASLVRRFGIVPDPACADWTRCYRLPRVIRDGGKLETRPTLGDPSAIGIFNYEPTEADIAVARELATDDGRWRVDHNDRQHTPRPPSEGGGSGNASDDDGALWLDPIKWNLDDPAVRSAIDLLVAHFPEIGCRNDLSMGLAGMLRRGGATESDAREILFETFDRGGSDKPETRAEIVRHTWAIPKGSPMRGFTFVCSLLGADVTKRVGDLFTNAYNNAWCGGFVNEARVRSNEAQPPQPGNNTPPPAAPPAPPAKALTAKQLRSKLQKALRVAKKKIERFEKIPLKTKKETLAHAWAVFDVTMLSRLLNDDHRRQFLDDRADDGKVVGDTVNAINHAMALVGQAVPYGTPFDATAVQEIVEHPLIMTEHATVEGRARARQAFESGMVEKRVFVETKRAKQNADAINKRLRSML